MDIAAMLNPGSDDNTAPGSSPHSPATQEWLDENQPLTLADKELMDQIDYALQSDEEWQEFRANTHDDNKSDSSVEILPVPPVKKTTMSKAKASKQGKKAAKAKSPPVDGSDDSSEPGNFKAYLEISTPAYKKAAVQTSGRKKKAESVKASSARSQLLTLPRDGLDARTLREKLAQTVGIDGDRFALTNLTWRFFTAARGTSQPLGGQDGFDNFLEYLNRKKNLKKEVLFVYERKIRENGTPKSKEYVPPSFPKAKPSKKKPADDDDDDPFYVHRHSDSDDSVVQAELNDQEVEAACKKVDDQIARNKDQILAKHKIGNCLDHPLLHCARDEHGNHYDMAHEPRLTAYASSIPATASVDKLPDTTWFTAGQAIKRAVPAAAPQPPTATAGQPDLTQLASAMNFGILGLVSSLLGQGAQAQLGAGAIATPHAPTPTPAPAPVTPASARLRTPEPTPSVAAAPPSSPIPELCHSMTLDEYCDLAEFSAETKEKLAALDHTPAQKVCKKRPAEWRKHFTVAAYAKVDEQDRMARTKIRRIDSSQ